VILSGPGALGSGIQTQGSKFKIDALSSNNIDDGHRIFIKTLAGSLTELLIARKSAEESVRRFQGHSEKEEEMRT
jgi:hypothetical protein